MKNNQNTGPVQSCSRCGREYQSIRTSKKYCSNSCKTLACREREEQCKKDREAEDLAYKAARVKKRQEDQVKKEQDLAKLNEQTAMLAKQEDDRRALEKEVKERNELMKIMRLKHSNEMEIMEVKNMIQRYEAAREGEEADRLRASRKKRKYIMPGQNSLPTVKTEELIQGGFELFKAFSKKTDQDLP